MQLSEIMAITENCSTDAGRVIPVIVLPCYLLKRMTGHRKLFKYEPACICLYVSPV